MPWLVKHAPSQGISSQSRDRKARGRSGSPGIPLPQELLAPKKQEETVWGRLVGGWVGVQQVVSFALGG